MGAPHTPEPRVILVVDDDWLNRELMNDILTVYGFQVLLANSGAQALALVSERRPDLILLDVRMPDMSGYEVCGKIKADERTKHIPVVMTTGLQIDAEERAKTAACGADDVVTRIMSTDELVERFNTLIAGKTTQNIEPQTPDKTPD